MWVFGVRGGAGACPAAPEKYVYPKYAQIVDESSVSNYMPDAEVTSFNNYFDLILSTTLVSDSRYTRNLVDSGNGKFNLMILCWGEGHGSSIHDHTDSHCFMKILQGNLKETLFKWPEKKGNGEMIKKSERVLRENQCAYINDSIGLHRVENISHTESAVSLHLYSPPFDSCNTFDQRTGHRHKVKMTFYSQFGERTHCATAVPQENN
ncbi:PREDICTED: cysteine dioxygenase type 1 [Nestor notabilis]|uniref:cysteine dioxygenase type 1 n=1 Tax=Nestor notabilis TaxID=176057 RepID=UPI000523A0D0|nr:PREDICTED: cysteine dioxygenase type 1 [Nestor notabilis]